MEHKKNWGLAIPLPNQLGSVSIYILWGEEDSKEGTQISGCYCEIVEQEGGEIFRLFGCPWNRYREIVELKRSAKLSGCPHTMLLTHKPSGFHGFTSFL